MGIQFGNMGRGVGSPYRVSFYWTTLCEGEQLLSLMPEANRGNIHGKP